MKKAEKVVSTIELGEEKGRTIVAVATKGTIAVAAGDTTLNFLITGVTFREIVLSGLGVSMETLLMMAILMGLSSWQQHAYTFDSNNT